MASLERFASVCAPAQAASTSVSVRTGHTVHANLHVSDESRFPPSVSRQRRSV